MGVSQGHRPPPKPCDSFLQVLISKNTEKTLPSQSGHSLRFLRAVPMFLHPLPGLELAAGRTCSLLRQPQVRNHAHRVQCPTSMETRLQTPGGTCGVCGVTFSAPKGPPEWGPLSRCRPRTRQGDRKELVSQRQTARRTAPPEWLIC